jgi:hypothetical protein
MSLHFLGRLPTLNGGALLTLPPRTREGWGREGQRAEEASRGGTACPDVSKWDLQIHQGLSAGAEIEDQGGGERERNTQRETEREKHTERNTQRETHREKHTERNRERETERETEKEKQRQTQRERETQREKQRERNREKQRERETEKEKETDTERQKEKREEEEERNLYPSSLSDHGYSPRA